MNSELILLIILIVIAVNYLLDLFSGLLMRSFNDKIPSNVRDIYNKEEYEKSQKYKRKL